MSKMIVLCNVGGLIKSLKGLSGKTNSPPQVGRNSARRYLGLELPYHFSPGCQPDVSPTDIRLPSLHNYVRQLLKVDPFSSLAFLLLSLILSGSLSLSHACTHVHVCACVCSCFLENLDKYVCYILSKDTKT